MESDEDPTTAPAVQPPASSPEPIQEYEFAWIINYLLAQPVKVEFGRSLTPPPPETIKLLEEIDPVEMFPVRSPNPSLFPPPDRPRPKSLTEAEWQAEVLGPEEIAILYERLKTEAPPLSLEQVRERRASAKQDRKRAIDFIRGRTNSRAAALGIPIINGVPAINAYFQGRARAMSYVPQIVVHAPINEETSPIRNRAMTSTSAGHVLALNFKFPVFDPKGRLSLEKLDEDEMY